MHALNKLHHKLHRFTQRPHLHPSCVQTVNSFLLHMNALYNHSVTLYTNSILHHHHHPFSQKGSFLSHNIAQTFRSVYNSQFIAEA